MDTQQPTFGEHEADAYRRIAYGEDVDGPAVDRLVQLGLISPSPSNPDQHIPHDPRGAVQRLLTGALTELVATVGKIEQLPDIARLSAHFNPNRWNGGPASEFLFTLTQMNQRIGEVSSQASIEAFTAQPGEPADRDPENVRLGTKRVLETLDRGVHIRCLYNTVAVLHPQTGEHIRAIAEAGAEVRALPGRFPRMILVDRRHLFVDNCLDENDAPDSGVHITDLGSVAWGRMIYGAFWDRATPWRDVVDREGQEVVTARQREILDALYYGATQDQVGPRLGLARRTVAKELAELREARGGVTMYQLMAWWGSERAREDAA
ncbi:hypothetical protein ACNYS0_20840 [Streptomyces sp. BH034]|uniref:hypothetical protein n=1 Tax=Streptomyces sp. BH034 TaxID=3402626 RepID=UPI003BB65AA4